MSENVEKALALFENGFSCCQAVVGTFCAQYGMDERLSMKIACGFAGGLRCGEVCGAVSGSVIIIGLKHGQRDADDKASKDECYKITGEFVKEFHERKGTVICRDLLGYDVRDTEARAKFPGRQKEVCPGAIETAVVILEEMGF